MCKWKAYQSSRVKMELPVVNHEDYFAKIGDDHKFPINKFGELANYLTQNKIVKKFHKPSACSFETLSYAHSKNYILDIQNKTLSKEGVKKIGFPLVDSVVQRSLVATGCLLYTSPSPRDRQKSRMPSSA